MAMGLAILMSLSTCVEPFEAETLTFDSALVIDATITNEMKQQQVFLSRTYRLEADGPKPVRSAQVTVTDSQGNAYQFQEKAAGTYMSQSVFAALPGTSYKLQVTTSNGRKYESDIVELTPVAVMDQVSAERTTNQDGAEGVAIVVDASSPSGNARNYRYTYEETYKIIAPNWHPSDLRIPEPPPGEDEAPGCDLDIVLREEEEHTCYATAPSNNIILTETNGFPEDRVSDFVVRFINRKSYIISHRYSILVRQLVQSDAAYVYFETLARLSGDESLFSQSQPGFLQGNVHSADDPEEKVLGYFDVASVTEKRIFFNYDDLFPGEALPPYISPCNETAPPLSNPSGCVLRPIVASNNVRYVGSNQPGPFSPGPGPYLVVPRVCGDCTEIGSTEIPEFWTE